MMMEWDSRMHNTQSVQILKAAIPFLDVSVGEKIDLEGLLGAIRPFASGKERRMIDMFLQLFSMKHMMEMMQLMQSMQEMQQAQEMAQEMSGNKDTASSMMGGMDPMELIKTMVPPEQQDTVEMMMSMMSAMQTDTPPSSASEQEGKENDHESVDF